VEHETKRERKGPYFLLLFAEGSISSTSKADGGKEYLEKWER